jgi:hypothetical protein
MSSSYRKDIIRWANERGWSVELTNGSHLKFIKPGKPIIFGSSTPGDWRAIKNVKAKMERADRQPK